MKSAVSEETIEKSPTSLPRPPAVGKNEALTVPERKHDTVPVFDDGTKTVPPPSGHVTYLSDAVMMKLQHERMSCPEETDVIDRIEDLFVQSIRM